MARSDTGFVRLGAACIAAGALGWLWAFFTVQAPSSPWHLAGLPLAAERFALHAWITGLAVLALGPRGRDRVLLGLAAAGSALSLGALAVSAATGLLGVQIRDARQGSALVLGGRVAGGALLLVALALALRARLREASPPDSP